MRLVIKYCVTTVTELQRSLYCSAAFKMRGKKQTKKTLRPHHDLILLQRKQIRKCNNRQYNLMTQFKDPQICASFNEKCQYPQKALSEFGLEAARGAVLTEASLY